MADLRNLTFGVSFNINDRELKSTNKSVDRMKNGFSGANKFVSKFTNKIYGSNKAMGKFGRTTNNVTNRSLDRFGSKLSRVTKIAAGYLGIRAVAGGIKSVGSAGLEGAADLEQYRNTLNRVMSSQEEAAKTFQWAVNFANVTPFKTNEIIQGAVKLESYGIAAKENMSLIGDMSSVMGKSLEQGIEAISDATMGEMERLKEFGIKKQNIVEWANKNMAKAQIVNNKGQITNQEKFNKALMGLMKDRFSGGMEMQANSFKGVMSTVKGVFSNSLSRMMGISATGEVRVGSMFDTIKGKVKGLSQTLIKWSDNGTIERWGNRATNIFNKVSGFIEDPVVPVMKDFGGFVAFELVPRLSSIGSTITDIVITALGGMGDETEGLKTKASNLVTGGLDLVNDGLNWVSEHEKGITDAIKAIGVAWVGYKGLLFTVSIIQGIQTAAQWASVAASGAQTLAIVGLYAKEFILAGATKAITVAQWAFNAALNANPIVLVISLVAGLVVGLVALYKKSETARNIMNSMWNGMKAGAKGAINFILKGINLLIKGLNKIQIKIPKWIPKVGGKEFGINIPEIPMLAKGTNFFGGGQAIVGERGPELVTMPRGAKVLPHKQTKSRLTESISSEEYREDINFAPTINIKVEGVSEDSNIEETIKNVIDGELTPILENYFNRLRKKRPALTER